MRRLLCLLAPPLLALAQTGCMSGACSPYWRFEVGKPGSVNSPAIVTQGSGPVAVGALGAFPVGGVGSARTLAAMAQETPCETLPAPRPALAATASCTMEDICILLRRIDARLSSGSFKPMPSSVP